MSDPTARRRTLSEWQSIIQECRCSGMTDAQWCLENGINRETMYSALKRLRRKACSVPERIQPEKVHDLTAPKQEVVKVGIIPEKDLPGDMVPGFPGNKPFLDNSHMIEISFGGYTVSLCNDADPVLVSKVLSLIRSFS